MSECADSTGLRTHLDHPDAELEAHLDACETCSGLLRSVAADAGFVRRALAVLDPPDDAEDTDVAVEAALASVLAKDRPAPAVPLAAPPGRRRGRSARRLTVSAAAAVLVLVGALTPAGRSAVAEVIDAFRGERMQIVTVDPAAWAAAMDPDSGRSIGALGELDTTGLSEPEVLDDVAAAEAVAGIAAPGLVEAPDRLVALAPGSVRLILVARQGNSVPEELDGAALVLEVPGTIAAVYGPPNRAPELVVARSGPLVVRSEGAPLEAIRSFVLAREELPADLRSQLTAIDDWRSTIPVPVPLDAPGWEEVEVAGRPAIVFGDDSGLGALVLRQDPYGVTLVGGRIGASRALDLAAEA